MTIIFTNGQGKVYDIPEDKFDEVMATSKQTGMEPGFEMRNAEGKRYVIPKSKYDEAVKGGLIHEPVWEAKQASDKKFVADETKRMKGDLTGPAQAMIRSVADTWTMGQGAKINAGIRSAFGGGDYDKLKEEYELRDEASRQANPVVSFASGAVASAPTMLAPVGGLVNAARSVGVGALEGGLRGMDKGPDGFVDGALEGGAWGSIPLGVEGLAAAWNPIKRGVGALATKVGSTITQLPEEFISRRYDRASEIRNGPDLKKVAEEASDAVENLNKKVSEGSTKGFQILEEEGVKLPANSVLGVFKGKMGEIKKGNTNRTEVAADIGILNAYIKQLQEEIKIPKVQRPAGFMSPADELKLATQMKDELQNVAEKTLDGGFVKRQVMDMDRDLQSALNKSQQAMSPGQKAIESGRTELSNMLKRESPAYAAHMEGVAKDTDLLQRLRPSFENPATAFNNLKQIGRDGSKTPFKTQMLEDLAEATGGQTNDLVRKAENAIVGDAFKGKSTNGSRNVNAAKALGGAAGGPIGEGIGAIGGYFVDTLAKPGVAKTIDAVKFVEPFFNKLGKYGPVLKASAQKGGNHLLLTHNLLLKTDPVYAALVTQLD